ncbi:uncharacterized protein LOC120069859 [Benincasa hispida]|uniref:uncharacterized protein LOC120069859 n=1 Tax=Benincasa hispida TaxID=102211 RepID=UPI001900968C|nr:uncharacterized protein LOC120069859 [Benincasa hispida]
MSEFVKESRERTTNLETAVQDHGKAIQNMEVHLSKMAISLQIMQKGKFPSCLENNPKEECKALTLRSREKLATRLINDDDDEPFEKKVEELNDEPSEMKEPKEVAKEEQPKKKASEPYPSSDILLKKKKFEQYEMISLTKECSAILQKKLPPKLKDPGSFTLLNWNSPQQKKLGLKKVKPITISLQMADRSLAYPQGIAEDVLVKMGELIFPADFVVLDMEEDYEISIILGRPFLARGRAKIDVEEDLTCLLVISRIYDREVNYTQNKLKMTKLGLKESKLNNGSKGVKKIEEKYNVPKNKGALQHYSRKRDLMQKGSNYTLGCSIATV